ncbi:hypothetical protein CFIMG_008157RA00001 [Ceratocystis fimbriata CBS 114723]|uniref:Flavoprotein domain-containing protein n=1 Tax=Ceratocystis fimbriata CBS 114723 TaxID=1035309 RepID=A0A2C5WXW2_9PEZI|nr:hypothetical protein CFIMG_008157RA00001 [Ceratocystis fimbriata CBS 114723]
MADIPRRLMTASPATSSLSILEPTRPRNLHVLVASTGSRDTSWAQYLVLNLATSQNMDIRAVVDDPVPRLEQACTTWHNRSLAIPPPDLLKQSPTDPVQQGPNELEMCRKQACDLVDWADILVLAPLDADGISKMLAGFADTMLLRILRGWDTTKRILLVPGMSKQCISNHMTQRQLNEIHLNWPWVRTLPPIQWHYDPTSDCKRIVHWTGFNEVIHIIRNQAELFSLGCEVDLSLPSRLPDGGQRKSFIHLPPELWSIIMDFTGDWELAQALGIYTTIPEPDAWKCRPINISTPAGQMFGYELENTALRSTEAMVCHKLSQAPPEFTELTPLTIKLIIRFSMVTVLEYLEANRPDLFKAFDNLSFTMMASAYYGRTDVLDFWKRSPTFKGRHHLLYNSDVVDGASKNGFTRVLDWWWRHSGLPLLYTEAALEQASARGDIRVLTWWREVSMQDESIPPRPGKSLLTATQNNRLDVIRWWAESNIAVAHGDSIPRMASRWGKVEVLELWRQLQGDDKLIYDAEILTAPTTHQHIAVLEWWLRYARGELPGMEGRTHKVPYRTCTIEEALEDSIGDQNAVRNWWTKNGLNLGVRNFEWMTIKYLGF